MITIFWGCKWECMLNTYNQAQNVFQLGYFPSHRIFDQIEDQAQSNLIDLINL